MFDYILEKINDAEFETNPFKFIYIEDFLSQEHFDLITQNDQINFPEFNKIEDMIQHLNDNKYSPVPFPGCTTDVNEYVKWYKTGQGTSPSHARGLIEGFGIAYRIQEYKNETINQLMQFLNSPIFLDTLKQKFGKKGDMRVETAIQKYLTGYEISPHPDIRKKCLTYMLNINPDEKAHEYGLSTHFMKFKPEYKHVQEFWKTNQKAERCWVPWDWCETVFEQKANNSITIFAPYDESMHAVKLDYDMLKTQRTQVYGNLWYHKSNTTSNPTWPYFQK